MKITKWKFKERKEILEQQEKNAFAFLFGSQLQFVKLTRKKKTTIVAVKKKLKLPMKKKVDLTQNRRTNLQ